jgi:hypothetical protein
VHSTDPSRDAPRVPGDRPSRGKAWLARLSALMLAAGCSSPAPPPPAPRAPAAPAPSPAARPSAVPPTAARPVPQRRAHNWDDYRMMAAHRIVAATPTGSYIGAVPEPLLAIPVLEVELNGDGSVRRITVLRRPRQALDTIQLAIDAVNRAAPFGDVTHLPRPWKFTEVFLFSDDRRFKPRSLDV